MNEQDAQSVGCDDFERAFLERCVRGAGHLKAGATMEVFRPFWRRDTACPGLQRYVDKIRERRSDNQQLNC